MNKLLCSLVVMICAMNFIQAADQVTKKMNGNCIVLQQGNSIARQEIFRPCQGDMLRKYRATCDGKMLTMHNAAKLYSQLAAEEMQQRLKLQSKL